MLEKLDVKVETVVEGLRRVALGDIAGCFDDEGNVLPLKRMAPAARMMVRAVKRKNGEVDLVVGPSCAERVAALDKLAKHLGMYIEQPVEKVPPQVTKNNTMNRSQVVLSSLTDAELEVYIKVAKAAQAFDVAQPLALPEASTPT